MSLAGTEQRRPERRNVRPRVAATPEQVAQARMVARHDAASLQEAMRVVEMAHGDWPEDRENEPAAQAAFAAAELRTQLSRCPGR